MDLLPANTMNLVASDTINLLAEDFSYANEGSANVVFRYTGQDPCLQGKVIRLRKKLASPSTKAVKAFHDDVLHALLGEFMLPSTLVLLNKAFLQDLNKRLITVPREKSRVLLDEDEAHGLLMKDLSHAVEFKPKWLVQSPSAPSDWTACRTCALRSFRGLCNDFCPLKLLTTDAKSVLQGICSKEWFPDVLLGSGVLQTLADLQKRYDSLGPLHADSCDINFLTAMTLRDCSILATPDRVYLVDLDLKDWQGGKGVYWRNTEHSLIDGGFYYSTRCR